VGVAGARLGQPLLDAVAGLAIAAWVLWSGYRIGAENLDYLMGRAPREGLLEEIQTRAREVHGVLSLNDVKAHYVGSQVHVEIHVEVDRELSTQASHEIGTEVRDRLRGLEGVAEAFVHLDPV
jgi:cation diffusion facilitator family transporter